MILGSPFPKVLMRSIAEWSIGRHLAVAQFIVAWLTHIESDGAKSRDHPLALTIAKRVNLTCTARAPIILLSSLQEHVGGEDSGIDWHTCWSISALLIWSTLTKVYSFLGREVCHIIQWSIWSLHIRWLQDLWLWHQHVSLMGTHLTSRWTKGKQTIRQA